MTHLRIPHVALGRTPRKPLLVIAAALTISTSQFAHAQTPVDANPAPAPSTTTAEAPTTAPAVPKVTVAIPPLDTSTSTAPTNSTPVNTSISPTATSPTMSSTTDLNAAARDSRTLNPLLLPTDNELRENLDFGRALGNSKQDFIV